MSTLYDQQTLTSGAATPRLRVVLLLDVLDGHEDRFRAAYEQIRLQVAGVAGHIRDQLCQSLGDASQWLITSEWESAEPFLRWMDSDEHLALVKPMEACVREARGLRFLVAQETPDAAAHRAVVPARSVGATRAKKGKRRRAGAIHPVLVPLPARRGVVRHALTFTIRPGGEAAVEGMLAGYRSPAARVDGVTRLWRTSLFTHENRVVLVVEVEGDLGSALRHVVAQPEVRAVEEAIGPYLEEPRDLGNSSSARAFFARAAMPAVQCVGAADTEAGGAARYAFRYPVRPGSGAAAAQLMAEQDRAAVADPGRMLAGSTMFVRDDVLVRMVDLRGSHQDAPEQAAGFAPGRTAQELSRHLDVDVGTDLQTRSGIERFLARCSMTPVTDRQAQDA